MTEYEALVEAVALSLANTERGPYTRWHIKSFADTEAWSIEADTYRFRARAAIATIYAVMREPSEAMICAGSDHRGNTTDMLLAAIDASPLNPEARNAD